ncbi:hypothetical protein JTE90_021242 [Oedothorax gibbosus]|uniref:Uncharacterized protein n=1 Tax=Oedothorax gibbosus TaxID=931172 RepID=A0AAV6UXZ8_9ARAC|nr:hypothetical protein JTE90_021242 [Oedothorax gibbosus]
MSATLEISTRSSATNHSTLLITRSISEHESHSSGCFLNVSVSIPESITAGSTVRALPTPSPPRSGVAIAASPSAPLGSIRGLSGKLGWCACPRADDILEW